MKMGMPGTLPKLCDPQEAPLKLNSAPLPPPLRAGILLIFSFQFVHYSSHSGFFCWNFKNHCAYHIVWLIS